MFGIVVYILASQMIYYITLDWTWFVWSATACLVLFGVGLLICALSMKFQYITQVGTCINGTCAETSLQAGLSPLQYST